MVCECIICQNILNAINDQGINEDIDQNGDIVLRGFRIPCTEKIYEIQLDEKVKIEMQNWTVFAKECSFHVIKSNALEHRLRIKFLVGLDENKKFKYGTMESDDNDNSVVQFCRMQSPVATFRINIAMSKILQACDTSSTIHTGLLWVNFVDTMGGDDLILAMYYDAQGILNVDAWQDQVRHLIIEPMINCGIMGRIKVFGKMRKRVEIVSSDGMECHSSLVETGLFPGVRLVQSEGSFSNPNGSVTRRVNDFLGNIFDNLGIHKSRLVELCSGSGNHTVGLAKHFSQVVSVEIDRKLVDRAIENLKINNIQNVTAICDDMKRLNRILRRVQWDAVDDAPSVVLVDPPRHGLDNATCSFVAGLKFDYLVYIACGDGLDKNYDTIAQEYRLLHLAFADHFPFTHFLEKIAVFQRKPADVV